MLEKQQTFRRISSLNTEPFTGDTTQYVVCTGGNLEADPAIWENKFESGRGSSAAGGSEVIAQDRALFWGRDWCVSVGGPGSGASNGSKGRTGLGDLAGAGIRGRRPGPLDKL